MKRYMRKAVFYLAPAIIAGAILAMYFPPVFLIFYAMGAPFQMDEDLTRIGVPLMVLIAIPYGALCAVHRHPICRPGYFAWLETTPYDGRTPLPYGPIGARLRELVNLTLIILFVIAPGFSTAPVAIFDIGLAFLIPYTLASAITLRVTGRTHAAHILTLGLALSLSIVRGAPWPALGILLILCPFILRALRKSLLEFPWGSDMFSHDEDVDTVYKNHWFNVGPDWGEPFPYFTKRDGVVLSILITAVTFVMLDMERDYNAAIWLYMLFSGIYAALRILIYTMGVWPPISFLARFATGRLIIPAYDKVFAGPLLGFALPFVGHYTLRLCGLGCYAGYYIPVFFGLGSLTLFIIMGPGLQEWSLTAPARLCPALVVRLNS